MMSAQLQFKTSQSRAERRKQKPSRNGHVPIAPCKYMQAWTYPMQGYVLNQTEAKAAALSTETSALWRGLGQPHFQLKYGWRGWTETLPAPVELWWYFMGTPAQLCQCGYKSITKSLPNCLRSKKHLGNAAKPCTLRNFWFNSWFSNSAVRADSDIMEVNPYLETGCLNWIMQHGGYTSHNLEGCEPFQ